jgi:formamidopyrimidine-DNA glycosylase
MPELPEVETICRLLRQGGDNTPSLLGMQIKRVSVEWEKSLATPILEEFRSRAVGQTIQEIGRRGKFVKFSLSQDCMLIHLRMSGDLLVKPEGIQREPHDRVLIDFLEGWRLVFNDTRKFGRVWLVSDPQEVLQPLGPEPLDEAFTAQAFRAILAGRRRQLKPLLMDQSFLAGMGNIYTDEALHMARLHPLRNATDLNVEEAGRLWEAIRSVLEEGIRRNGASIDWVYRGGDFQNYFRVYGRLNLPCPRCSTPIQRMVVGQRSTYYCPICQVV